MSRPVDREKHNHKRSIIVGAAASQFAAHGFNRTTTAGICREAGISSGTFFHYFPTKVAVLVATLESGCNDLRSALERIEHSASGLEAVLKYAAEAEIELADSSYPVFVAGLAGIEGEPSVAAALATEADLIRSFLTRQVEAGQLRGDTRHDASVADLATWVSWLLDGAAQAAATGQRLPGTPVQGAVRALLAAHERYSERAGRPDAPD